MIITVIGSSNFLAQLPKCAVSHSSKPAGDQSDFWISSQSDPEILGIFAHSQTLRRFQGSLFLLDHNWWLRRKLSRTNLPEVTCLGWWNKGLLHVLWSVRLQFGETSSLGINQNSVTQKCWGEALVSGRPSILDMPFLDICLKTWLFLD